MDMVNKGVALEQDGLLWPAWVRAALSAHQRLRLYLALLRAADRHAHEPESTVPDFGLELEAAGCAALWLRELPGAARLRDEQLEVPRLARLVRHLGDELALMVRPLMHTPPADFAALAARVQDWQEWLDRLDGDRLSQGQLHRLLQDEDAPGDGLPRLVEDLHRHLVQLSASFDGEVIDGAHVRHLEAADRSRLAAFMRGLRRTAPLRLDHPGLDTVAVRDSRGLLLQSHVGSIDGHVLTLRMQGTRLVLSYSDLHRSRFEFFRQLLEELGLRWSQVEARPHPQGHERGTCHVGTAHFDAPDETGLLQVLEGMGARMFYLIDWNRARKRLMCFTAKADAIQVLAEAARREIGHLPWLAAGGEQLVYRAMQALGDSAFRNGERLEDVLGSEGVRAFLLETLQLADEALRQGRSATQVADETRLLLATRVPRHAAELDLLARCAAHCRTLAQAVVDALAQGPDRMPLSSAPSSGVPRPGRHRAGQPSRSGAGGRSVEAAGDAADALDEALFLIGVAAELPQPGWDDPVQAALVQLAQAVLRATQELASAVGVVRSSGIGGKASEPDAFASTAWKLQCAVRQGDELQRSARRLILTRLREPVPLKLASETAMALGIAAQRLQVCGNSLCSFLGSEADGR